jgi:hypothetical protein
MLLSMFVAVSVPGARALAAEPVRFLGVNVEGKNIAFVCDGSRWMKNKVDDLAEELAKTVEALREDQSVSIIFFADDKAFGPNAAKPQAATKENKEKLKDWLKHVESGDQCTPIAGLERAFESKADAVFFVAEGRFDNRDEVASKIDALNPKHATPVHAIAFFKNEKEDVSRSFYTFMKKLAEDNRGEFKVVYVDELRRR